MPNQMHSAIAAAEKESVQPFGLGHGYLPCAASAHATSYFSLAEVARVDSERRAMVAASASQLALLGGATRKRDLRTGHSIRQRHPLSGVPERRLFSFQGG